MEVSQTAAGHHFNIKTKYKCEAETALVEDLQHLVRLFVRVQHASPAHFTLDINNLKSERQEKINTKVPKIAKEWVIERGKSVILTGLNSFERFTIHELLKEVNDVQTLSVGLRESRKLVLMASSESGTTGLDSAQIIDINNL